MARKKRKDEDEKPSNFVDLKALDEEHEKLARHLGYKEKCSVNNIARGREHEVKTARMSHHAAIGLGVVAAAIAGGALAFAEDRQTRLLEVAGFLVIWAVLAVLYAKRATHRVADYEKLGEVVRAKLGK